MTVAAEEVTLRGTFVWVHEPNQKHELIAKLTATGPNQWDVVWNLNWKQHPLTLIGTVKGGLHHGPVSGTGDLPDRKRRFMLDGTGQDGAITFDHYEVTHGRNRTGSGEMRVGN